MVVWHGCAGDVKLGAKLLVTLLGINLLSCIVGGIPVGINYGLLGDNLPPPSEAALLLEMLAIPHTKMYSVDIDVLTALSGTEISIVVGIGNEYVAQLSSDPVIALTWVEKNIMPFYPATLITGITVGNEVFSNNDTALMDNLLQAMMNLQIALATAMGSDQVDIPISTAHALDILGTSYPPSIGVFREDLAATYIAPLLDFLSQTGSPFMINAYPYFAYKSDPKNIALDYVLLEPNATGIVDPNTGLHYDNMLEAQVDSVYSALEAMGHPEIQVVVSETGWPSIGDPDEVGASFENAKKYNGNLLRRMIAGNGTPLRPSQPVETYIFALFNEDLKPGPTSERNYGLFHPNGTKVYDLGINGTGMTPSPSSSSSPSPIISSLALLLVVSLVFLYD